LMLQAIGVHWNHFPPTLVVRSDGIGFVANGTMHVVRFELHIPIMAFGFSFF
jgi:hypothetical protein